VAAAVGAWRGRAVTAEALDRRLAAGERRLVDALDRVRTASDTALRDAAQKTGEAQVHALAAVQQALTQSLGEMRDAQQRAGLSLQERVETQLGLVRADTEAKLEKIRASVEERLHATLETRLGESFRVVGDRLEQVHKGLGEMQALAAGVGDLKRVLTNVRSRGTFGEVQLGALLAQVLTPEQYVANVAPVPGSSERVEFAIRLPGRDGNAPVLLPIDAKFPQEDYLRLQQAYEDGNAAAVDESLRALRRRLLGEAETIRQKYLAPPHTTDFALLFLPTEGLYAEVLRVPGLTDELQSRHRVIPAGPTTLYALLNSLQMGFRTLAIEQRSSEVWRLLGAVKTEFLKFGDTLDAVSRKLDEAGKKIGETTRRSRAVEQKLRAVEAPPEAESAALLPRLEPGPEDDA